MDEAWLDAATADLDNHWVPTLGGGGGPAAPTAPATAAVAACGGGDGGSCEPSIHPSATATVSALGARPRMGAWSEGELGVQTGGGSLAAKWQPQPQQPQQPQQPPSPGRSEASHGSSAQGQTREAALRDLAEEWGCTDPKLAEALMRRKQKMQRAGRKTEQKRSQKDPMKRLAALQRKVAVLPPHAEAQHSPRQPLVLARHEPGAAENAGMRRLSPRQLRLGDEGGYAAGCEEEMQQEIQDDLDLDLASDELHDEPLRSFASDAPNAKLRRSMRPPPRAPSAPLPRAELPTGSRSLNGSRLSSPVVHGVSSLPVGSALQAARASSAGRFSGT